MSRDLQLLGQFAVAEDFQHVVAMLEQRLSRAASRE